MTKRKFYEFINFLQKDHKVYGPILDKSSKRLLIEEIDNPEVVVLDGKLTYYSFKRLFFPACETLFKYKNNKLKEPDFNYHKQVALGMTVFDLKALNLYDQVFAKDPYYQSRRQETLVIGYSIVGKRDVESEMIFQSKYEEHILEHLKFDIFLEIADIEELGVNGSEIEVFTGSYRGQEILNDFNYRKHEHIEYVGPIREEGLDKDMVKVWKKLKKNYLKTIWEELGKRCIECGQCAIVCPTCYCFRIDDEPSLSKGEGKRNRCWDACMYHEFSEIAGDYRSLSSTAQRMWFYFYHKFVRVPEKYKIPGCVKCGRCTDVCPVGIDFMGVLDRILKS